MLVKMYDPDGSAVQVLPFNVELMISRGWSKKPPKAAKRGKISTEKSKDLKDD